MGWSSWSLESTNYPGVNPTGGASWLTEAHVKQQADVLSSKLKSHGYDYVNVDAGWVGGFDAYGRPIANATTFPDGLKGLGHLRARQGPQARRLPGRRPLLRRLQRRQDARSTARPGCTTKDIVYPDLRKTNGWDNVSYQIELRQPLRPEVHRLGRRRTRRLGRGLPQGRRRRARLQPGRRRARQHPRRPGVARRAPAHRPPDPAHPVVVAQPRRRPPCGSRTPTAGGSTPTSSATATRW